ncbi:peptidoglycan DD-metalloendopeptidase family protein [bacterium SCSIO 12741]|nr:peptidoglycan DD-metalloendopeptidase family protein [bacterium SCSIO 12741]
MKQTLTIIIGLLAALGLLNAAEGDKEGKPVKKAVVFYGESLLFQSIDHLSDEHIQHYYDSLKQLPEPPKQLMDQIDLFLSVKTMTQLEIALMMDSLFEKGGNNYALINQINLFISQNDFNEQQPDEFEYTRNTYDYPADLFYNSWNTQKPHPYSPKLCQDDTTTRLKLAGGGLGEMVMPVDKIVVTSLFGYRWERFHRGVDLDLQVWDTVRTMFSGKVRYVGYYGGYGRTVVVRHHNGLETLYAHLHRFKVKVGDDVDAGQLIALGGSSGHSTGSHLHFECRFKGVALNPSQLINFKTGELIDDQVTLKKNKWGYTAIPDGVEYYTVKKGDYLYKIADMYGTTCTQLCEANGIKRNSPLRIGQKIRIL